MGAAVKIPGLQELRWRCRRGMLELDILLNTYLDVYGDVLTVEEIFEFENFLDRPDQELQGILVKGEAAKDENLKKLILKIKDSVVLS